MLQYHIWFPMAFIQYILFIFILNPPSLYGCKQSTPLIVFCMPILPLAVTNTCHHLSRQYIVFLSVQVIVTNFSYLCSLLPPLLILPILCYKLCCQSILYKPPRLVFQINTLLITFNFPLYMFHTLAFSHTYLHSSFHYP